MNVTLSHKDVREAIREYMTKRGYKLAVPKTVNQNTGLVFKWYHSRPKDSLEVTVELKEGE